MLIKSCINAKTHARPIRLSVSQLPNPKVLATLRMSFANGETGLLFKIYLRERKLVPLIIREDDERIWVKLIKSPTNKAGESRNAKIQHPDLSHEHHLFFIIFSESFWNRHKIQPLSRYIENSRNIEVGSSHNVVVGVSFITPKSLSFLLTISSLSRRAGSMNRSLLQLQFHIIFFARISIRGVEIIK